MNRQFFQKLILALVSFVFCLGTIQAGIITVDNSSNGGGQYSDLQLALDAAQNGDTIHVIGSNTTYGGATVRKPLTIIGSGYNPPNQFNLPTKISTLSFGGVGTTTASGSKLMGVEITGSVTGGVFSYNTSGITIERCEIWSLVLVTNNCSGWVVQNNLLSYLTINNNSNFIARNNIIGFTVSSSNQPNVMITNNLFTSTATAGAVFANIDNAVITNNIFYFGRSPQGCDYSTFNNNITYNTNNNTLPYGTNSGANNLVNTNPQFVNATTGGYDEANDYHLQATSPGVNAGTDNTDIGIYGSVNPFPIGGGAPFITSAPPSVPQIIEMNILNANVVLGDSLQVHIRARKQN